MKFHFKLEDIKYSKILYKDNNLTPCVIKAGIKRIDEREILACSKYSDSISIETPQEVTLSIICSDGLYRTKTILKKVEKDDPYIFYILNVPQGIEYEQNREYFRVKMACSCKYKISETQEYKVESFDISANGISIIAPTHILSETESELDINLNGRIINTKIQFIRSEKLENEYKLSFTYTKIANSDRDYISQVCLQKQLEQRRNSLK